MQTDIVASRDMWNWKIVKVIKSQILQIVEH